jgi:hypothetical protein
MCPVTGGLFRAAKIGSGKFMAEDFNIQIFLFH